MGRNGYDIFISYRRKGGKNYARTLKPELEKRGYRVFLDFDELKDGVFDKRIMDAISEAPVFMVILSEGSLDRCVNDGDWVRQEILFADKTGRHIVPIEFDKTFREFPAGLPDDVKSVLGAHQFSQIDTETLLQESVDKMVRERVEPYMAKTADGTGEDGAGAEIHIETDADLYLYRFKKLMTTISADEDNVVYLKPGKHKLEFVSKEYDDVRETRVVEIPSENYSDIIEVFLQKEISERKQKQQLELLEKAKAKYDRKEWKEAFDLFSMLAEQGNSYGQMYLGEMYQYGWGVARNFDEAFKWFKKSAEQGNSYGQMYLGEMYHYGWGVARNDDEAFKWYKKAAEQGNAEAQCILAEMYEFGNGVAQNREEAIRWYREAAEHGVGLKKALERLGAV